MKTLLSILICSLESRAGQLATLQKELKRQQTTEVEILTELDAGELSIGAKRQALMERSKGDFIVSIDDDDLVAADYMSSILYILHNKIVDCIGIQGIIREPLRREQDRNFYCDLKYKDAFFGFGRAYLPILHICPILRTIAIKERYPFISCGEDGQWLAKVSKHLKTQEIINRPIYVYNCNPDHTDTFAAVKRLEKEKH